MGNIMSCMQQMENAQKDITIEAGLDSWYKECIARVQALVKAGSTRLCFPRFAENTWIPKDCGI